MVGMSIFVVTVVILFKFWGSISSSADRAEEIVEVAGTVSAVSAQFGLAKLVAEIEESKMVPLSGDEARAKIKAMKANKIK